MAQPILQLLQSESGRVGAGGRGGRRGLLGGVVAREKRRAMEISRRKAQNINYSRSANVIIRGVKFLER